MKVSLAIFVLGIMAIVNAERYATKPPGYKREVNHPMPAVKPATRVYAKSQAGSTKIPAKAKKASNATEAPASYETKATIATSTRAASPTTAGKAAKYKSVKPNAKPTITRHKREMALLESNDLAADPSCKPCKGKPNRCIYGFEKGKGGCSTCTCANPCNDIKCANGLKCNLIQINCIKAPCEDSLLRLCLPRQMVQKK